MHVVHISVANSFLLVSSINMTHTLFICFCVGGHLPCYWLLATLNDTAMNILIQVFCGHTFSFIWSKYFKLYLCPYRKINSKCIITNFKVRTKKFLDKNSREYLLLAWGWQYHVRILKEKKNSRH